MNGPNKVDVDDVRIAAELAAVGVEKPAPANGQAAPGGAGDQAQPGGPAEAPRVDWIEAAAGVVLMLDKLVAPNWNLTLDEKFALTESLAKVGAAFFPDLRMDPRLLAVGSVVFTVGAIAKARRDPETGKLPPLRVKRPAAETPANEAPPAPAPADGLREAA